MYDVLKTVRFTVWHQCLLNQRAFQQLSTFIDQIHTVHYHSLQLYNSFSISTAWDLYSEAFGVGRWKISKETTLKLSLDIAIIPFSLGPH